MRLLRKILKGSALTASLFVFQACYGTYPADDDFMYYYKFHVIDENSGDPIGGVSIECKLPTPGLENSMNWYGSGLTDENGIKYLSADRYKTLEVRFDASDQEYMIKDTIVTYSDNASEIVIKLKKAESL